MNAPPITLDPTTLASFLIGTVLPLLIAWLQSTYATSRYKALFAFLACAMVAAVVTILTKSYSGTWGPSAADNAQLVALNIVAILASAWTSFARLWQPIGATGALEQRGPQLGAAKATKAKAGIP